MSKHIKYLAYVLRHKFYVFLYCVRYYGMFWAGLTHDLSKLSPDEYFAYVDYFYGNTPDSIKVRDAFDVAWNHHQKRNPHHWQYWLLKEDEGAIKVLKMKKRYAKEMLCDWAGVAAALGLGQHNVYKWYYDNKDKIVLHQETRAFIESELPRFTAADPDNIKLKKAIEKPPPKTGNIRDEEARQGKKV